MEYQITSDNIEVTDSMKALAQEKLEKIEERLTEKENKEALARVVMNKSSAEDGFRVKIELSFGGKKYFASERDFLLESAIIKTVNEVERMRRKDDVSYMEDWKKQREIKRSFTEELLEEDAEEVEGEEDEQK